MSFPQALVIICESEKWMDKSVSIYYNHFWLIDIDHSWSKLIEVDRTQIASPSGSRSGFTMVNPGTPGISTQWHVCVPLASERWVDLTMGWQWVCPSGAQVGFEWVNPNPWESHRPTVTHAGLRWARYLGNCLIHLWTWMGFCSHVRSALCSTDYTHCWLILRSTNMSHWAWL